jgi:tetratricopeptide (TPR) repeat protein
MMVTAVWAAEPLPLAREYWEDPAFQKAFNGSYRIEARIEPSVTTAERGLLVEVQGLMEKGQRTNALEKLKGSTLTSTSAALTYNLGNLHFEKGEDDEAVAAFRKAVGMYPSFRRAHRNLALALVRSGKLEEALEPLLEAVRLGDASGATYGLLAYCRLRRGEWASALQAYRLAQVSEPEVPEWKAGVAQCLENLGGRAEAAALLDEVIRMRPAVASYAVLQARLLLDLDRPEDAVKTLELPRRLGTLDADGLLLLADLHLRAGRGNDAVAMVEEAFAPRPAPMAAAGPDPGRVISLIHLAMNVSEWDLSRALLEKVRTEDPSVALRRVEARFLIASEDDEARGEAILRELLKTDPTDGESLIALGQHLANGDRVDDAELLFQRATVVDTHAADAWIELARLYVASRRYGRALEAVDKALELRPAGALEAYRESLARLVEAGR